MRPVGVPVPRLLAAELPALVPLALLAVLWASDPIAALGLVAGAAAAAIVIRRLVPDGGREFSAIPLLGAVAYLSITVPIGPATDGLVGISALGVLAWFALADAQEVRPGPLLGAMVLPALGLGIALSVSILFPVARQSVGIAAVLLVGALALLAWSLLQGAPEPASEAVPPSL